MYCLSFTLCVSPAVSKAPYRTADDFPDSLIVWFMHIMSENCEITITISITSCFVWPTVQNLKIFNLLLKRNKEMSKYSHLKSWYHLPFKNNHIHYQNSCQLIFGSSTNQWIHKPFLLYKAYIIVLFCKNKWFDAECYLKAGTALLLASQVVCLH